MKVIAIAVVLAALSVSGCKTAEERQAAMNSQDDETCKSYGAKPGTDVYTQCRMLVAQNRTQQAAADNAAVNAWLANTQAYVQSLNRPRYPAYVHIPKTTYTTNCQRYSWGVSCTSN